MEPILQDEIARAIVAPGHSTSKKPGPWRDSDGPNMAEYAQVMTVRQLMDLVAYIRSLPGGTHDGFTGDR